MPHSGGGGSHGGGSHHSSHSSHSSGHGSSGVSTPRVSSRPFKGSHTYVIYGKLGRSRLIYSDSANYKANCSAFESVCKIGFSLFFVVPGIIAVIVSIALFAKALSFGMHKTVYSDSVDDNIYIYDEFDCISEAEEKSLITVLEEVRDKTGIIPSVEFTRDDQWVENYYDMESFSYNEYVNHFYDEYHLLVVYSVGYHDDNTGFNEFNYHTMWGDDLSKTASTKDEDIFLDILAANLSRNNGNNLGEAFENTFTDFLSRLKGKGFNVDGEKLFSAVFVFVWGLGFGGCGLFVLLQSINELILSKKAGETVYQVRGEPKKAACAYCGCSYYVNTIGNCPNCNAPIPADNNEV